MSSVKTAAKSSEETVSRHPNINTLHKEILSAILSSGVDAADLIKYIKENIISNSSKNDNHTDAINLSRDSDNDATKDVEKGDNNHVHNPLGQLIQADQNRVFDNGEERDGR